MAEGTKGEKTERVVLERVRATVGATHDEAEDMPVEAWVMRGTATGSRREVIKAVVGDAQGVYRAPSARSWKGAIEQSAPVVRQRSLED